MAVAVTLHLLSAVVWVGGMFFAYMALRPAALALDPPQRLTLWAGTFARFFPWVWASVALLPATGYWLVFRMGGFALVGLYVHVMQVLGIAMIAIFLHVYFVPYRRLRRAVAAGDFTGAGRALGGIRRLIGLNLSLGLLLITAVTGGKYWAA